TKSEEGGGGHLTVVPVRRIKEAVPSPDHRFNMYSEKLWSADRSTTVTVLHEVRISRLFQFVTVSHFSFRCYDAVHHHRFFFSYSHQN
ncbi:hypothetical protein AVEN_70217-1, partial [Araneus ventricosus]